MTTQSDDIRKLPSRIVAEDLARRIESGELRDGDRLASEMELAKEFGVARGTMRNALEILQNRELIETKSGVGSFVSFNGHAMSDTFSWTDAIAKTGSKTTTEVLDVQQVEAPDPLHSAYHVDRSVYRVVRRRTSESRPISIEISFLPSNPMLDLLMERGLLGGSISLTMKAAGMNPHSGVQDATVETVPERYRDQLGVTAEDRFLVVRRASLDAHGDLVEYVVSYLNPEHFSLHIEFGRTPTNAD
ncbi:MAG: GntR family transcriptional regulator [Bifidobacterium sp.]|jgi:GntR family transcriptional regulator|nr:GntR family transcriptional regulator [Bifidobacterium sp.]